MVADGAFLGGSFPKGLFSEPVCFIDRAFGAVQAGVPGRSATRGSTNKPSVRQIAAGAEGCVGFVKIFYLIFIPDTRDASYFTSWLNLTRKGHPRPSEGGGFNSFSQERIRCSKAAERIIARQKGEFPQKTFNALVYYSLQPRG